MKKIILGFVVLLTIASADDLKIQSSQVDALNQYILTDQELKCREGYATTVLQGCIKFVDFNSRKTFQDSKSKTIASLEKIKSIKDVLRLLVSAESIYSYPRRINGSNVKYTKEGLMGTLEGIIEFLKKHKIKSVKAAYFPPTVKASFYINGTFKFGYLINREAVSTPHSKEQKEYFERIVDYVNIIRKEQTKNTSPKDFEFPTMNKETNTEK